MTPSPPRLRFW